MWDPGCGLGDVAKSSLCASSFGRMRLGVLHNVNNREAMSPTRLITRGLYLHAACSPLQRLIIEEGRPPLGEAIEVTALMRGLIPIDSVDGEAAVSPLPPSTPHQSHDLSTVRQVLQELARGDEKGGRHAHTEEDAVRDTARQQTKQARLRGYEWMEMDDGEGKC